MHNNIPFISTIIKLHEIRKYSAEISRIYRMNPEELRELQLNYLKKIVIYAYNNVKLYREKWDKAGVSPKDIKEIEDLHKLPIITKNDLKNFFPGGILAKNYSREDCCIISTSGSTGTPVRIFVERDRILFDIARSIVWSRFTGIRMGTIVGIVVTSRDSIEYVYGRGIPWFLRRRRFFTKRRMYRFDVRDYPKNHISAVNKIKPDSLLTYPSVLKNMALTALEEGITISQPRLIITFGEVLDMHTRKIIEKVFNSEIINVYGATETGTIASECLKHEGLHIAWNIIVELIKNGKPVSYGEPGQVVVTDLIKNATPIIRYSGLGDVAVMKRGWGTCNLKSPLLELIEGRLVDSVILKDGRIIHPYTLTLLIQDIPFIAKFQIIQKEVDEMEILIVPEKTKDTKTLPSSTENKLGREICKRFKKELGDKMKINITFVEDIPRRPGSYTYATVLSLVSKELI